MRTRQDPERMKRWLSKRDRHGWSWAELSRRSGLPVWKLRWWCRRLAERRSPLRPRRAFVPVEVVEPCRDASSPLVVITPSGLRVLVGPGFDTEHLRRLMKALGASC